jgi:hypothetical protein
LLPRRISHVRIPLSGPRQSAMGNRPSTVSSHTARFTLQIPPVKTP